MSQDEFAFINGGYMMVMKSKLNVVRTNNVVIMAIPSCREYWAYPRVVNIWHTLMSWILVIPSCREYWAYPHVVKIGHILMLWILIIPSCCEYWSYPHVVNIGHTLVSWILDIHSCKKTHIYVDIDNNIVCLFVFYWTRIVVVLFTLRYKCPRLECFEKYKDEPIHVIRNQSTKR